jgi:hypothetical protein
LGALGCWWQTKQTTGPEDVTACFAASFRDFAKKTVETYDEMRIFLRICTTPIEAFGGA